jgi:uncharacterized protein (DUF433 family)
MNVTDYFEVVTPTDIRVKGTRVGIETILNDYLDLGLFPEDIALRYPTLSLEAVYATITYYWGHQQEADAYLRAWKAHGDRMRREQETHPSPAARSLRNLLRQHRPTVAPPAAEAG